MKNTKMEMASYTLPTVARTPLECDQQSSSICCPIFTLTVSLNLFFGGDFRLAMVLDFGFKNGCRLVDQFTTSPVSPLIYIAKYLVVQLL